MITKFDSSYYGTADMENLGYAGTPINERRYPQEQFAKALRKVVAYAKCMDERGYNTFWMAEHHFQPEGTELIPNLLMMAMHLCDVTKNLKIGCGFNVVPMWHPLRLAEDYAMADILTGGRVIFGVARGYHTREVESFGSPLIDQDRQPRIVRGRRRHHLQGVRGKAVLAPGQVLHDPAGGAVSRLYAEGDHPGARPRAPAGRMLAADPERLGPRLRFHGQARHLRRHRRRLGRGRRGGAAHARVPGRLCAPRRSSSNSASASRSASSSTSPRAASRRSARPRKHYEENMKMFGELRLVRALSDEQIAAMRDPKLAATTKLPTIEDAVKAGGFLAGTPADIIEALKAVEKRYPGIDRVMCARRSAPRSTSSWKIWTGSRRRSCRRSAAHRSRRRPNRTRDKGADEI